MQLNWGSKAGPLFARTGSDHTSYHAAAADCAEKSTPQTSTDVSAALLSDCHAAVSTDTMRCYAVYGLTNN